MRARLGDGRATARLVTLAVLHASLTFYLCKVGWWWHLPHKVFTVGLGDSPALGTASSCKRWVCRCHSWVAAQSPVRWEALSGRQV